MTVRSSMRSARKKANKAKKERATAITRAVPGPQRSILGTIFSSHGNIARTFPTKMLGEATRKFCFASGFVVRAALLEPASEIIEFGRGAIQAAMGGLSGSDMIPPGPDDSGAGSTAADDGAAASGGVTRADVDAAMPFSWPEPTSDGRSEELTEIERRHIDHIADKADVYSLVTRLAKMEKEVHRLKRKCETLETDGASSAASASSSAAPSLASSSAPAPPPLPGAPAASAAAPPPPPPPPMPKPAAAGTGGGGPPPPPPPPMPTGPLSLKPTGTSGGYLARAREKKEKMAREAASKPAAPSTPVVTAADIAKVKLRSVKDTPSHAMTLRSASKPRNTPGGPVTISLADINSVKLRSAKKTPRPVKEIAPATPSGPCIPTMADIVGVKLRKVGGQERSPGGTPMRSRKRRSPLASDDGGFDIGNALLKKFRNHMARTPEKNNDVSDLSAWDTTAKKKPSTRSPLTTVTFENQKSDSPMRV